MQFLLRHDRGRVLSFATLQGSTAAEIRARLAVPDELDSLLFVRDYGAETEQLLVKSSGALAALDAIGGGWRLLSWLSVVPRVARDAVYDFVARRRLAWFGRLDACRIPGPGERDRFVD